MDWLYYENEARQKGYQHICGVDEAGRGPLCGPVVAAAVILRSDDPIEGLNDSKKLTENKREVLYDKIKEEAISYGIAYATAAEIDELNILNAALLAMRRAIEMLDPKPDFVLVDGNQTRGFTIPAKAIVKGDAKSPSIAAASILAKVERDRSCIELDKKYPEYGFVKHKGYPTKEHYEAIKKYGITPEHRRSFRLE
jgi:ribonuclease HII